MRITDLIMSLVQEIKDGNNCLAVASLRDLLEELGLPREAWPLSCGDCYRWFNTLQSFPTPHRIPDHLIERIRDKKSMSETVQFSIPYHDEATAIIALVRTVREYDEVV